MISTSQIKALSQKESEFRIALMKAGYPEVRAEAIVHALVDIAASVEKIYSALMQELILAFDGDIETFKDRLWSIREEFRQINYHVQDAELLDL